MWSNPAVRASAAVMALGTSAAGVVLCASPAAAEVSITPSTAIQGDAASVTFLVANAKPGTHTVKVEVDLPQDTPVAEVYPMTVPDWAPQIVYRESAEPVRSLHGPLVTTLTSAVIWTRADDEAPAPPAVESLRLEMGPMPASPSLSFTVIQTYADGTVQRWQGPAAAMTLTPAPSASGAAGSAADAGAAGGHVHGQVAPAGTAGATDGGAADGGAADGGAADGGAADGAVAAALAPVATGAAAPDSSPVTPVALGLMGGTVAVLGGVFAAMTRRKPRPAAAVVPPRVDGDSGA